MLISMGSWNFQVCVYYESLKRALILFVFFYFLRELSVHCSKLGLVVESKWKVVVDVVNSKPRTSSTATTGIPGKAKKKSKDACLVKGSARHTSSGTVLVHQNSGRRIWMDFYVHLGQPPALGPLGKCQTKLILEVMIKNNVKILLPGKSQRARE